ncbi:hypothetical protein LCGC14_1737220 [marine sediment metagenome]|uniref:Uncharacterized protein n=1 Tax=marine sediment metagenome TaxID=412755 RepID=A0A0F9HVE0_9ZZZZ
MPAIASRLKDVLWSLRRRFGMEADLDRIIPYVAFERTLTRSEVENLFPIYPKRVPEEFKSALLDRVQQMIREYQRYQETRKGYHRVLKGMKFLEKVAGLGFEGCCLIFNKNTGFRLELKKND